MKIEVKVFCNYGVLCIFLFVEMVVYAVVKFITGFKVLIPIPNSNLLEGCTHMLYPRYAWLMVLGNLDFVDDLYQF